MPIKPSFNNFSTEKLSTEKEREGEKERIKIINLIIKILKNYKKLFKSYKIRTSKVCSFRYCYTLFMHIIFQQLILK